MSEHLSSVSFSSSAMGLSRTMEQALSCYQFDSLSVEKCEFVVVDGPHAGTAIPLRKEHFFVGRADWCDVALPKDRHISTVHCELRLEKRGIRLMDKGSRNGCFVQDCRVLDVYLRVGQSFKLGGTTCCLRSLGSKESIPVMYHDESGELVGQTLAMREIFAMLSRLGDKDVPVVLMGETGTGKSTIARVLHQKSGRSGAFVTVNCGALSPSLVESELFGYEKGAFTGAMNQHKGLLEQANGGTLFLDEIAELPLELQPKLLDVLERKCVRRLGGRDEHQVDFRLVTATHCDLEQRVKEGVFREDLFYRLAVMELTVPALRDRKEDIPLLAGHILERLEPERFLRVSPAAHRVLQSYYWPGNLRELRNVLQRSVLFVTGEELGADDLMMPTNASPLSSMVGAERVRDTGEQDQLAPMKEQLARAESLILEEALLALDWNVSKVAQALEVSRSWLHGRIRLYELQRPSS